MRYLLFIAAFILFSPQSWAYTNFSPYDYCCGNPLKYVDPTGEDVVILNYSEGEHMAMLIQNEDGKWQYFSINGDNFYVLGKHSGGRPFNDIGIGCWTSPQEFLNSEYNRRNQNSKEDKSMNNFGYNEGFQISTTKEQDAIMRKSFIEQSKTRYTPLGNNCTTTVQRVLFEVNIPVASPKYETIHIPANFYLGEPAYDIVRPNFNPLPSSAFKTIMFLNPEGKYIHK